jgi:hypothetical protein
MQGFAVQLRDFSQMESLFHPSKSIIHGAFIIIISGGW